MCYLINNFLRNLTTIVSGWKYVAQPFVRRKVHCCYISALVLICFHQTKGCATYFQPETIVVNFLHLMVLLSKELLNHSHVSLCLCFFIEAIQSGLILPLSTHLFFFDSNMVSVLWGRFRDVYQKIVLSNSATAV